MYVIKILMKPFQFAFLWWNYVMGFTEDSFDLRVFCIIVHIEISFSRKRLIEKEERERDDEDFSFFNIEQIWSLNDSMNGSYYNFARKSAKR